jgi:hypothetical protein
MLTKNLAILYFDLPMSSDYTSLMSSGVLSGAEVDFMSGSLIGAKGQWDSFINSEIEPAVTIYDSPGKPPLWRLTLGANAPARHVRQVFSADLAIGLFVQRQDDFLLEGEYPLEFTRVYTNQDDRSRTFGMGTTHSLDAALVGQMGSYVELIFADGSRVRFEHARKTAGPGDPYLPRRRRTYTSAVYAGGIWTINGRDGSKLYMPYRPQALSRNVTVLAGFTGAAGHLYRMERNSLGDLQSVTTPGETGCISRTMRNTGSGASRLPPAAPSLTNTMPKDVCRA